MNLLIDMGNSRIKWVCSQKQQLSASHALLNEDVNLARLLLAWQNEKPQAVYLACVNTSALIDTVYEVIATLWQNIRVQNVQTEKHACGVQNGYLHPEKLGVDRWLALLAARAYYANSAVAVIDCGTAITIDVLNAQGQHQGGLISSGLYLMQTSLKQKVQHLPFAHTTVFEHDVLAQDTQSAIAQGTLLSAMGLIESTAKRLPPMPYILTGGDAEHIAPHLSFAVQIERDLVLRGLALIADST